ncbi:MAG: 4-hydroxy-3-methylbut-2-enyl diphosphate reductase [Gemmatimonas sp. SG8_28]|nr:MAG: 4-hydroxy-3-methylbut-2-enyl diphosphate reductase [Gemmatimonas sp. SG8_28]
MTEQTYFRKGFGLRKAIEGELVADYHSRLVDTLRSGGNTLEVGGLTIRLAEEFGFCYGVDRAVEYAYETRTRFLDQRVYLVGEIIHNPHVNEKLETMGISVIHPGAEGRFDFSHITSDDVVIVPAFGMTIEDFTTVRSIGCPVVDTTCGSVLNVWKRVESYARDGYTAIVHGKHFHEETKATASQVSKYDEGKYLIVRDMDEALTLCGFIRGEVDTPILESTFRHKVSEGLDFERDLVRVGLANQTTMLSSESLEIAQKIGEAMADRYGPERLAEHFRSFGTICSATQERQDAVLKLIEEPLDAMVVIGGYNSSNTNHLAKICAKQVTTYHIADSHCIDVDGATVRHKPVDGNAEIEQRGWLDGVTRLGITAGASTPNNKIGEAIERILRTRELPVPA